MINEVEDQKSLCVTKITITPNVYSPLRSYQLIHTITTVQAKKNKDL